jgi:hypothetical protein
MTPTAEEDLMPTLTMPQLVAGRGLAAAAVQRLGPLDAAHVLLDARPLVSGTASFAGQVVRSVLLDGHAAALTVIGGPDDFLADIRSAADKLDVTGQVSFVSDDADLHVAS